MIRIKRVYEPPSPEDGTRILVDRLWPRGVSREAAHLDAWRKELSPSDGLRKWYAHDPAKFARFRERYLKELDEHVDLLSQLAAEARRGRVTLVFAAKEPERSNAAVLKERLDRGKASRRPAAR